jgi:hypothetical protein
MPVSRGSRNSAAGKPFSPSMSRHLLIATLLAATLGPVASATAAEHCQHRPGEHQLARSAQAVVFERTMKSSQNYPVQTITGCSRRSGHRRVIDVLQRRSDDDPTKLVGLRLAGTRVAYVRGIAPPGLNGRMTIIADDAIHGGRRHDLGRSWPFDGARRSGQLAQVKSWAVNVNGDVAWITVAALDSTYGAAPPTLVIWHAGLGRRQIDTKADLRDLKLAGSVLSWRHNGARRSLDIAAIPRSACKEKATIGTLDVDLVWDTACLRATGKSMNAHLPDGDLIDPADINGPYILSKWVAKTHYGLALIDLVSGSTTTYGTTTYGEYLDEAVVDTHGSVAWLSGGNELWVHDANGTRTVAGRGTDGLLREGSTVTWPGGPVVTLSP